ncbi:MAG TPA: radical SAM protein [Clostridia bacterium]|nr:radical SAM protein [Clostridia bacterium]
MKILLVTSIHKKTPTRWIPIGIAYIASKLISYGHIVKVYDKHRLEYMMDKKSMNSGLRQSIIAFAPDIIGFSTISPMIYDTVETVEFIRTFYRGTLIAGGHHATAMPFETLKKIPGLDYVIAGEGEIPLTLLAEGSPVTSIPGLISRDTDSTSYVPSRIDNLDVLPLPDYSVFDMDFYTKANRHTIRGHYLKTAEILTSRGCPNNCSFCSETLTYGKGVRFHSPDYVMANIEHILENYKINSLYFHDNDFLISRKHAEDICRMMIDNGYNRRLKWAVQAGTNNVDEDILRLMSEAGCIAIEFGMESIKDSDLNKVNKNRSVQMSERAIELCSKYGISVHGYFMTGLGGDSISSLNSLLAWIDKYQPHTFSLNSLKIHPGTEMYEKHGNSFFETHEWTKENIDFYYISNSLDEIPDKDLDKWRKEVFIPFKLKHERKWVIKNNSPLSILLLLIKKILSVWRRRPRKTLS